MDINKALRELYEEKRRLDVAIAALEGRLRTTPDPPARGRRGRKTMSAEERLVVSKRMSKYWEARRVSAQALETASEDAAVAPASTEVNASSDGVSA